MRPLGFSTGALALGDFELALQMLRGRAVEVVELSALREPELSPLVEKAAVLELAQFRHVSVHAPSRFEAAGERSVALQLRGLAARGFSIVLHPDSVHDFASWRELGDRLLVENMDRRKPGHSAAELVAVFEELPEAGFCFDVGHARQCDGTMAEARLFLERLGTRLRQIHLSEVTESGAHTRLSDGSIFAAREVASLIPERIPIVLESPVTAEQIDGELERARSALPVSRP